MMNSTQVSYFILAAYLDTKMLKYFFFLILLVLYVVIVGCNVLLLLVICLNRTLHQPMYMFLCSLFVNELYGSSSLFPFLLLQILSDVHTVPAPLCFLQIYCVHSYFGIEFFTLTIMSYDRYLAICHPLQYNTLMTIKKVALLIAVECILSFLGDSVYVSMSFSLQLCGNVINKVYCNNYSIVKLACSDTKVNNIYGLISTVVSVFVPVALILYTYIRILKVCFSGSEQTRQKAVSTCTPHLASLLNFCFGVCFDVLTSRFDMTNVPNILQIFLSLYFLTCQPLFNPLMYGLNMSKIRSAWKNLFFIKWR